jgi:NADPH-dependent 2,4-dienoyl-CoA reductase/sulfur reductase-like enzyme
MNNMLDWPQLGCGASIFIGTVIFQSTFLYCKRHFAFKEKKGISNKERLRQRGLLRKKYNGKKNIDEVDTIIIGSGMSGLSCAAVLSRLGKKVLVLEQHEGYIYIILGLLHHLNKVI